MADYKVVFRADESTSGEHRILWEPGCPALLSAVQASRNMQTSEAYLQIKIRNVSNSAIKSVGCTAKITYADEATEDYAFEDLDVDLTQGAQKPLKAQLLPRGDVECVDVVLTSVTTSDEKWRGSEKPVDVPEAIPLAISEKGMAERLRKLRAAGVDVRAHRNAVQDRGSWWVCACGQVNVGRDACCECGSDKELLLGNENDEGLLSSADDWAETVYQKALGLAADVGNASALAQAADLFKQIPGWKDADERLKVCDAGIADIKAKSSRKTKRIAAIVGAIAVVLVAVALLVVNVAIPNGKYNDAVALVEAGQYDEAVAAFQELGDYKDSKAQVVATYAEKCTAQLAAGDNEGAIQTIETLKTVGADAEEIDAIAKDAASKAMDEENYAVAVVWYDLLGDADGKQEAEYAYASTHQDRNDELTYQFLSDLRKTSYKDSEAMFSNLFDWRFEFAVSTYDHYEDGNWDWVDIESWDKARGFTSVELLVRATSGPPNQRIRLQMDAWRIKARTQLDYTGEWVKTKKGDWGGWVDYVDVYADDQVYSALIGSDLYSEAFKVTVTNPDTGEVLYEKEVHRNG